MKMPSVLTPINVAAVLAAYLMFKKRKGLSEKRSMDDNLFVFLVVVILYIALSGLLKGKKSSKKSVEDASEAPIDESV